MSIMGRRIRIRTVLLVAVCLVVATLIPVMSRSQTRDIHLVVRDMSFYLEGDPGTANPAITVRAGERVRIVVRNDDRGIAHDFALPVADAATRSLVFGEQAEVTLTVPSTPGSYEYVCRPHRPMMRGLLVVVP